MKRLPCGWSWLAVVVSLTAAGCPLELGVDSRRDGPAERITLQIQADGLAPLTAAEIQYQPAAAVVSARLGPTGALTLERRSAAGALTIRVPGRCPVTLQPGPQPEPIALRPVIDLGGDRAPIGFESPFTLVARHGCPERGRGRISWRQLEGSPIDALAVTDDGFRLTGRTPRFEAVHPGPLPAGLVPISPRTQGRVVLEASWQGPGLAPVRRTVTLVATSRATGLSSVAVSQQLLLSGAGWRVARAPQAGHARVHASGALSLFTPDAPGRWALEDAQGKALTLAAFWHDKTPYDCGRSECHRAIAQDTTRSPMSHALERQLTRADPAAVSCMLDCHVLGERGLRDGGFLDVASELGWSGLDASRWHELPQALRRLGGVRCTACHGPGAIPEPDARAAVLRSDVCATCHDAPPRYVHVEQWRASKMSGSDQDVTSRSGSCARCHTTAGFLASVGARAASLAGPPPAPNDGADAPEPLGIACAACHAPHASHSGARLIRALPTTSLPLEHPALDARSAICVPCHTPAGDELQPTASSAALWLGGVRVPSRDGAGWETIRGGAAHRAVPGGCVGCHGGKPGTAAGPIDHSFRVDRGVCRACHTQPDSLEQHAAAQRGIQQRAEALAGALAQVCRDPPLAREPWRHHAAGPAAPCRSHELERARHELGLVLGDPAAAFHDAALARGLLDDAERQLKAAGR